MNPQFSTGPAKHPVYKLAPATGEVRRPDTEFPSYTQPPQSARASTLQVTFVHPDECKASPCCFKYVQKEVDWLVMGGGASLWRVPKPTRCDGAPFERRSLARKRARGSLEPSVSTQEQHAAPVDPSGGGSAWYFAYAGTEKAITDVVPSEWRHQSVEAMLQNWCVAWQMGPSGEATSSLEVMKDKTCAKGTAYRLSEEGARPVLRPLLFFVEVRGRGGCQMFEGVRSLILIEIE